MRAAQFPEMVLRHLDAAYNLARWLAGNDDEARAITEEACRHVLQLSHARPGHKARVLLLGIVRNIYYDRFKKRDVQAGPPARQAGVHTLSMALESLPPEYRELIVLRELEDLPCNEVAEIIEAQVETVMLRLARARRLLREEIERMKKKPEAGIATA